MISAVADYKFLTPSGILIDGGVYPRRQGAAREVLRGEDAAFIREAACRISYPCGHDSGTTMSYGYFPLNTAPHCAGLCEKYILKKPLQVAAETIRDEKPYYARSFLTATPVWEFSQFPAIAYTLPEALSIEIQTQLPDANTAFDWELSGDEISAWESAIQSYRHPTARYSYVVNDVWGGSGFSNQWIATVNPTYLYDSENWTPATAPRRRQNLEAIYNQVIYYTQGGWSDYNGSITTTWNQNRTNEWTVYFRVPNKIGVQWTDRDGNVHAADDQLADSLVDKTTGSAQAVLQFLVQESLTVSDSGGNVVRSKTVNKYVCEPCDCTWDSGLEGWVPDKMQMYNAAFDAMTKAGAELNKMADITPPAGGSSGASTSVYLCAIHGIFTLDHGLVVS